MSRYVFMEGVSFKRARGHNKMIITADLDVTMPEEYIANIDANEPGNKIVCVASTSNELCLTRLLSMAGQVVDLDLDLLPVRLR